MSEYRRSAWYARYTRTKIAAVGGAAAVLAGAFGAVAAFAGGGATAVAASTVPTPSHVVVVMEENHSFNDIIGDTTDAPYFNSLASQGALMTGSFGVTHPSEPNYMALFGGDTFGLTADSCPVDEGTTANLGSELLAAGDTFSGYAEGLPSAGSTACTSGEFARKHTPWANFDNIPAADEQPLTSFPTDYSKLPTVSFVIPNLDDDMHDGTIAGADSWLNANLSGYATWAQTHDSVLIVTWDEDDYTENNQIPTIIVGQPVKPGRYSETINHYNVLATLEDMYGLAPVGQSATAAPITDIWTGSASASPTPTPSPSASASASASPSASPSASASASASPTPTASPTKTASPTPTATATGSGLLANPGFESGSASPWSCDSLDSIVSSPVHSGSYALSGAPSASDDAQCTQTVAVAPNTTYKLSAYVHGAYAYIGTTGDGTTDVSAWSSPGSSWGKISTTFTTGASTTSVKIWTHGWYGQTAFGADDFTLTAS